MKKFKLLTVIFLFFGIFLLFLQPCFGLEIGTVQEPPGNFKGADGKPDGLSVDFVKEIQKRIGDTTPINILPGARLIHNSLTKPDYVIFSLSRTGAREEKYHWITLMMRKPLVMFAKKGSGVNVKTLDDAKKVSGIGVMRSSVQHEFLTKNGFTNAKPVIEHEQNVKKLLAGRVDLAYHSMQGMAGLCKSMGVDFNELEPVLVLQVSKSSIAMSKSSDPGIVKKWQDTAKAIKDDGTFEKMAQKWAEYTEKTISIKCEVKDGALNFWQDK
ncbi:MAG: amino acid ABC transporter substrate-binding protein [Desulfobacteraceae bacterium]|nr:amino acid ABC transporter substrate-binding protein [Desulfobacteraceae bacterium]